MLILDSLAVFFLLANATQSAKGDGNALVSGNNNTVSLHIQKEPIFTLQKRRPVRSELKLPDESVLLRRQDLIGRIAQRFSKKTGITTVALVGIVGMGGVGKTTLARMWGRIHAHAHPTSSVFEINAETPTSIISSFRELAVALAQTSKQKEELGFIDQIKQPEEKERQRLSFVKARLKEFSNWLLIYDNVENLHYIANPS